MDWEKYSFSFYMRSKSNPFNYEVPENEKEKFYEACNLELKNIPYNTFFCFETINGLQVCVSLKHLQFAYNLFDPDVEKIFSTMYSENNGGGSIILSQKKDEAAKERFAQNENIHIYLRGRKEILKCGTDDPVEAFNIIDFLQYYPEHGLQFLSFSDIDDETIVINPEDILVLELPRELYNKGYVEIFLNAETDEDIEADEDDEEGEEGEEK